jgi:hypothetical protein
MADFIECTSLSINYDIMGIATVTYTVVHDFPGMSVRNEISAGGQTFSGYVTNASVTTVPNSQGWFETHATLIATTN